MAISGISIGQSASISSSKIDEEEKKIMKKLIQYGYDPTGQKNIDKAILHKIELEKAKEENEITDKFLTVTIKEQKEIQEKKSKDKTNQKQNNILGQSNNINPQDMIGAKAYGEQVYLALMMKNKV